MGKIKLTVLVSLISTMSVFCQVLREGRVMAKDSVSYGIPDCYVINSKTNKSTTTDDLGFFELKMSKGDTLVISNIQYKYGYYWDNDSTSTSIPIIIKLESRNFLLDEVSIFSYTLTSNKPKPMPIGKPQVPDESETQVKTMAMPSMTSPIDMLYYYFGSRPKQLRKLKELQKEDYYRERLRQGKNRAIISEITGLTKEEIEQMAFFCKYNQSNISTMTDYQLLVSILNCYRDYISKKESEDILNRQSW